MVRFFSTTYMHINTQLQGTEELQPRSVVRTRRSQAAQEANADDNLRLHDEGTLCSQEDLGQFE